MTPALESFAHAYAQRGAAEPPPLGSRRDCAMSTVLRLGLPTVADESWRYTNLRPLAARRFARAASLDVPRFAALSWFAQTAWPVIPLVNGAPRLELANALPLGIETSTLARIAQTAPQALAAEFSAPSDAEEDRWAELNIALSDDGLHLEIRESLAQPLVILQIIGAPEDPAACHPRVSVRLAAGVRATLIEHFVSALPAQMICNSVTDLRLARGAQLEHYAIVATGAAASHFLRTQTEQAEASRCMQHAIVLGAGLARLDVAARLAGRDAHFDGHLLAHASGGRHVDYRALVRHAAPATRSRQTMRAVAGRRGRIVQNSKVIVDAHCPGADSMQSCRGMLLSPQAEIDTRPQLEIYTDAVKCAHGAATGKLDANMLFYLLSRGIDRQAAEALLVSAFVADALTGIAVPQVRAATESRLAQELSEANGGAEAVR